MRDRSQRVDPATPTTTSPRYVCQNFQTIGFLAAVIVEKHRAKLAKDGSDTH